jgi:hypothetical protein
MNLYYEEEEESVKFSFSFDLPLLSPFNDNNASVGKDIFLFCLNLTKIVPSSFSFIEEIEEGERGNRMKERDETPCEEEVDLFFYFSKYKEKVIHVSLDGFDSSYCGLSFIPCLSFDVGKEHLKNEENGMERKIMVSQEVEIKKKEELEGVKIEAEEEEEWEAKLKFIDPASAEEEENPLQAPTEEPSQKTGK